MNSRIEIINTLIKENKYKSYLEIGVNHKKHCFDKIVCDKKISVDPSNVDTYDFNMTSDNFFEINKDMFDIIFVDGLHTAEQVEKDIINSLIILTNGGSIVVHDTNPPTELHCTENPVHLEWTGTVWKTIFMLRSTRADLVFKTYMDDWGVTIITRGIGKVLKLQNPYFSYNIFAENKKLILNT